MQCFLPFYCMRTSIAFLSPLSHHVQGSICFHWVRAPQMPWTSFQSCHALQIPVSSSTSLSLLVPLPCSLIITYSPLIVFCTCLPVLNFGFYHHLVGMWLTFPPTLYMSSSSLTDYLPSPPIHSLLSLPFTSQFILAWHLFRVSR